MQNVIYLGNDLYYVGGNDRRIALFEGAYPVPRGVSYNSYLLVDEKTVLFDTVDHAVSDVFFENVAAVLGERKLNYLVINHMEPDHSASLCGILSRYPEVKLVVNQKTAVMLKNYFGDALPALTTVKEGDALGVGKHRLTFLFAPMVHWPEVMFTFEERDGTLFSADAFGSFGALAGGVFADELNFERDFSDDARRYYFNIVGKYGVQVQNALKKAAALPVRMICPLHGPVWREELGWYLKKYDVWSRYEPEERGVVIFYASVYAHTENAAEIVAAQLNREGVKPVKVYDVSVTDRSFLLAEAFRFSHAVFASVTFNGGIFVGMDELLGELTCHAYKNRAFSVIENGSWSPQAGRLIEEKLNALSNMRQIGERVSILSAVNEGTREALCALAKLIADDVRSETR